MTSIAITTTLSAAVQSRVDRKRGVLALALLSAVIVLSARAADAKSGASVSVSTTATVTGTAVSGVIAITNSGSKAVTVTAVSDTLEVRFPSGTISPSLPTGSAAGWYTVATVALPSPGLIAANSSKTIAFTINTCRPGVAPYAGAKDMRSVAVVSAGSAYSARSLNFALPAKCPLCGNGIVEAGELCDQGYNGGACCTASCQYRSNGTACNDANGCTQADQCQAGVCVGSPVRCAASDACHVAGTCNPTTGLCSNPAAANGSPCDDRNACTQTDACQSGICRGANAVTCPGTDQCQQASCNPATGTCSSQAKADGTECIDGDACTLGDRCLGGACVSGAARDCDDHLSCTDDECAVATGCGHTETPICDGCDAAECAACGAACETANAQCADHCWSAFFSCLNGCTTTYCAPFCQADLSQCVTSCPSVATCRDGCDAGNGCATGCSEAQ